MDSEVDPHLGQPAQFILYDTGTNSCEIISNAQSLKTLQGAEIRAAEANSRGGDQVLVTGYFGPQALETLAVAGIEIVLADEEPTVTPALKRSKSG